MKSPGYIYTGPKTRKAIEPNVTSEVEMWGKVVNLAREAGITSTWMKIQVEEEISRQEEELNKKGEENAELNDDK